MSFALLTLTAVLANPEIVIEPSSLVVFVSLVPFQERLQRVIRRAEPRN